MRIIRPGSVVGPQQQYMYLKQLEWVKWSAMDEAKRQVASAAKSSIVTPATPPAETDDEMDTRSITPPINTVSLPPVTPSRHIASATAQAKAIVPPGQPRKTPKTKRMAEETEEDDDDALPAIPPLPTTRNRSKTLSKVPNIKDVAATEQRPIRVTRSTAGAANIRRAGTAAATSNATSIPESPVKAITTRQGPHKIPRLATTRTTAAARAVASATSRQTTTRAFTSTTTPSRLPTLMSSKRPHHTSSLSEVTENIPPKAQEKSGADGWVNNTAVVGKTSKSDRPNLRSVRRRRSSFSNADVVVWAIVITKFPLMFFLRTIPLPYLPSSEHHFPYIWRLSIIQKWSGIVYLGDSRWNTHSGSPLVAEIRILGLIGLWLSWILVNAFQEPTKVLWINAWCNAMT